MNGQIKWNTYCKLSKNSSLGVFLLDVFSESTIHPFKIEISFMEINA